MSSSSPEPRPPSNPPTLLDYESERSRPLPRTHHDVAAEFARATLILVSLVASASMFLLADQPPDPPAAGLCVVVGTSVVVTAIGAVTLWATAGMRHALLGNAVRVRSHLVVVATAAGYVAQLIALAAIIGLARPGDRGASFLSFVPLVPTVAPLWILPRRSE